MAFRADEAARLGYDQAASYLIPGLTELSREERERSKQALQEIVKRIGPPVETYPVWHPLVSHQETTWQEKVPRNGQEANIGYKGLDHTRFFAHGFITCPYGGGQDVIEAVDSIIAHPIATLKASRLSIKLYHPMATPILVECIWHKPINEDFTIPTEIAVPLMLEKELPNWYRAEVAETWENMRLNFMGSPHGAKSSLFISQETGQAMKKVWTTLLDTGMFGEAPIF